MEVCKRELNVEMGEWANVQMGWLEECEPDGSGGALLFKRVAAHSYGTNP